MPAGRTLILILVCFSALGLTACGSGQSASTPIAHLVTPTWGPPTGGTPVALQVIEGDGVYRVLFNDQDATDVVFVRDQLVTCTTPIGLAGWADITVIGYPNQSTWPQAFLYLPEGTWVRADGGADDDVAHDVGYRSDGSSVVVGSFEGSAVFGAGESWETTLTAAGGSDAYVARYGADGALIAVKRFGGLVDDAAFGVAALADDGYLVVGTFAGEVIFGEGETNETTLRAAGGTDGFLARYASNGRLAWVRGIGGTLADRCLDVIVAAPDVHVVAGSFSGTIVLGVGEAGETELDSAGLGDALLAAYDADGNLQWAADGGGVGDDVYASLAAWPSGRVLAVGTFTEEAAFGGISLVSAGERDGVVGRYFADGRLDWVRGIHGKGDDVPRAAAVYDDEDCVVTGSFEDEVLFAVGDPEEALLASDGGDQDLFLARYHDDGVLAWASYAGGRGAGDTAEGISLRLYEDGTCLVLGAFRQEATFGPRELFETRLISAGASDLAFARYTAAGTVQWAFRDGGTGDEVPSATRVMIDDSLLVTGAFSGTASLDPSGAGPIQLPSAGERDPFLGRYDVEE